MDFEAPSLMLTPSSPHTDAYCDLDLWPPESNHVISRGQ